MAGTGSREWCVAACLHQSTGYALPTQAQSSLTQAEGECRGLPAQGMRAAA